MAKILYKYCVWDENTKENIIKNQIYSKRAIDENDPFEMLPRYNEGDWIARISLIKNLKFETVKIHLAEYFDGYYKQIRTSTHIASLAEDNDNILMWSHYADCHKGVCLGYSMDKFLEKHGEKYPIRDVIYNSERIIWPSLIFNADKKDFETNKELVDIIYKTSLTKSKLWSYEKEKRVVAFNNLKSPMVLRDCVVVAIYIGINADEKLISQVLDFVRTNNLKIKIYKMVYSKDKFEVKPKLFYNS